MTDPAENKAQLLRDGLTAQNNVCAISGYEIQRPVLLDCCGAVVDKDWLYFAVEYLDNNQVAVDRCPHCWADVTNGRIVVMGTPQDEIARFLWRPGNGSGPHFPTLQLANHGPNRRAVLNENRANVRFAVENGKKLFPDGEPALPFRATLATWRVTAQDGNVAPEPRASH